MELSQRVRAILSFVQAADAGGFAAAGRVLGISSAAVSKNVAGLEQALGVRLMNRTTRTISLTDEGSVFLRQARVALEALESAGDALAYQRGEASGHVRISTSAAFGRDQLIPALPALQAQHPGLSVEVDFDDRVVDLVRDGYDLAIRGGHISDSALVSRPVCRLNLVLVASPDYLSRAGIPRSPRDLLQHRLISRRFLGGRVSPWNFRTADGSISTLDLDPVTLTFSAPEALAQAASLGLGVTQVGVHHAWPYLRTGKLKVLLLDVHDPGSYEMVIQYPHRALMAPRVRVTVDHLLATFAKDQALHVPPTRLQKYSVE
ncbi:LysR family transcriptional regulator [Aromatoleum toluvorans]|uniref:LysR family transcriptional regulator n=1 Tax=Aromatoleum toluvorans TaxID=92002 RepID=A0ABX1Q324_9RHOO|nr:LysR family transcriptional regulator [Aromatoleum toluvorans]NMG46126.1 LysR family transcriptional regulator [Aromatoleum toluvorans]